MVELNETEKIIYSKIYNTGDDMLYTLVHNKVSSIPPKGKYQVTNLYVDPDTGKLVIEYDNTPVP